MRNFYEAETDVEIMIKLIEGLQEEVVFMKNDSVNVQNSLSKIGDYFERRYMSKITQ